MYLCDTNVWLALALSAHVHHRAVRDWLDTVHQPGSVAFCRATPVAFVTDYRIVLQAREPANLESVWRGFALRNSASPKIWMDAYLAAFALLTDGRQMVTNDGAFRQFEGLNLLLIGH